MTNIDNIHDNFFRKVLSEVANARTFLQAHLPEGLQQELDLSEITLDPTSYISEAYKEAFSDVVVKCRMKAKDTPVDVYILFEHKSFPDKKVLMQLLRYMHLMWEKDGDEKKPLRIIVPFVFYHGKDPWRLPRRFVQQFPATERVKKFLLDYEYILFDTNAWDWEAESNQPLKQNVFLLSALLLMKAAFQQNVEIIRQVFQLWNQMGFVAETDRINFLMIYIVETHDIPAPELTKMLEESQIIGEETMPTLAQRWREEGKEQGMQQGMQLGHLLGKQEALIMLLVNRFQMTEAEKQFIAAVNEADKLNAALQLVITADSKEKVLSVLKNGSSA
ncbi:MAG: Rpn family recombination-promoting nuclease/putative transposase [candidate division KSB1 bacterium]